MSLAIFSFGLHLEKNDQTITITEYKKVRQTRNYPIKERIF
jgi:hypothetical protein